MTPERRILLVVGAIGSFVLLVAIGIALIFFWGWNLFTSQVKEALNENPVILEHLGEIDRIELDVLATGDEEGEEVFVFRVEGPKGSGAVTAEIVTFSVDKEEIRSGTLQLSSGETYDLLGKDPPSQPRALQFLAMIEDMAPLEVAAVSFEDYSAAADVLRKFSDQDLTLADAVGLHLMEKHEIEKCWSTDCHLGLTGVSLVIHDY